MKLLKDIAEVTVYVALLIFIVTLGTRCADAQVTLGGQQIHLLPPGQPLTGSESIPMDQGVCTGCTFRTSPAALATYIQNYTFTFSASQITSGTLACARLPTFTGAITTSGCSVTTLNINGTTVPTNGSADQTIVTTAPATGTWASLPSCLDQSGQHLNYNTSTHSFSCGTTGGSAGSVAFSGIANGTNTTSVMVVGSGATLSTSGTGTISATTANTATTATTATTAGAVPASGITGVLTNAQLPTTLTANTTGNAASATTAASAGSVAAANISGVLTNAQLPTTLTANTTGNAATATSATTAASATTATSATSASTVPATGITGTLTNAQLPTTLTASTTGTAASLTSTPSQCSTGYAPTGVAANGNAQNCQTISGGTGSVTSLSVVTANGLAGTVANPTTTPAITLSTPFTGVAYSNGTGLASAVAGNFPTLNQSTTGNAATATSASAVPATGVTAGALNASVTASSGGALVGISGTQTLTNKSMDGGSNTFTNLTLASLQQSSTAAVLGYPGGSSTAPEAFTEVPSGVTLDVSSLTQTSNSDVIPINYLPGTLVSYPAGSHTVSGSDNGTVLDNTASSASTFSLPPINAVTPYVIPSAFQSVMANFGSSAVTTLAGITNTSPALAAPTLNGAAGPLYLGPLGWSFTLTDGTGGSGNYVILEGGGYQFNSAGTPVFATSIEANGFIPTSANCGLAGTGRIAAYTGGGLTLCTNGTGAGSVDAAGDLAMLGYGSFQSFVTGDAFAMINPGSAAPTTAGIYYPTTGQLWFGTNGSGAGHIDAAQNWYISGLSTYSLVANSGAGTLASIGYGGAGTFLRSTGTSSPPSFSTNTIPNTATTGDLWYANATNTLTALPIGSSGAVLTVSGGVPTWSSGATAPTVGCVAACPASNTGVGTSVTVPTGSGAALITGTSFTWVPGEAVTLAYTTQPTNFPAGTYYVNSTGLTTSAVELCTSPPTFAGGLFTACTSVNAGASAGSGVTLTGVSPGNYINYGTSANSGFIVLPEGTYSGATTLSLTFSKTATNGYECHGVDLTASALMLQTATYSTTYCRIAKASAAAALDVITWGTEGPT